jgi:hypothetical protein
MRSCYRQETKTTVLEMIVLSSSQALHTKFVFMAEIFRKFVSSGSATFSEAFRPNQLWAVIFASCFLSASSIAQESLGQSPTWVADLRRISVSWDRATISWQVIPADRTPEDDITPDSVVLESRKQGELEWSILGNFPFEQTDHTNQTPRPKPPEIILPKRILARPPPVEGDYFGSFNTDTLDIDGWPIVVGPAATYTHHRLEPDRVYEYRMKGTNSYGEGSYSPTLTLKTSPIPLPEAPARGFVRNLAGGGLQVLWTRSSLATEFLVQRNHPSQGWQKIAVVAGTQHSWKDDAVSPGEFYQYRVIARNSSGNSDFNPVFSGVARDQVGSKISPLWSERRGVSLAEWPEKPEGNILWFNGAGTRSLTTRPLVFLSGGFFEFDLWCDEDSRTSYPIFPQASLNGRDWVTLCALNPKGLSKAGSWRTISIKLPIAWSSFGMKFRLVQKFRGDEGEKTWAIRDIRILSQQSQ